MGRPGRGDPTCLVAPFVPWRRRPPARRAALAREEMSVEEPILGGFGAVHGHAVGQPGAEHMDELVETAAQLLGPVVDELEQGPRRGHRAFAPRRGRGRGLESGRGVREGPGPAPLLDVLRGEAPRVDTRRLPRADADRGADRLPRRCSLSPGLANRTTTLGWGFRRRGPPAPAVPRLATRKGSDPADRRSPGGTPG